jgi:hypothetical protein
VTCAEPVLVELPDGFCTVRACTRDEHDAATPHLMRFRGADLSWTHGRARIRVETLSTVERQPSLV